MQEKQRDQVLVAVHDEACGFFRRLGINNPAKFHALVALVIGGLRVQFLVRDDSNRESADSRVTAD